ncbi:MAG: tRNA threonylcarbamoyladenosine dehydratase [Clostridia bacterium]|nr:tRNA threonylcarbamoyladenosine dehydratase [Clostridia bacterium]
MLNPLSRLELMIGGEAVARLKNAHVAVFGVGGVGGYTVEALARSGVGALTLVDDDTVNLTNLNRQIIALHSTLGQYKVDAAKARILDINPDCRVNALKTFFLPENADAFDFAQYDYVVDAIDTVSGKIELAVRCQAAGVPLISCMGAGNKLDPTAFVVTDISKTSVCPLARVMRRELRKRGVERLKVVYSTEPAREQMGAMEASEAGARRSVPASNAFVPAAAGLIAAGEVIREIAGVV